MDIIHEICNEKNFNTQSEIRSNGIKPDTNCNLKMKNFECSQKDNEDKRNEISTSVCDTMVSKIGTLQIVKIPSDWQNKKIHKLEL